MSNEISIRQSLASSCAVLIAFIGLVHEVAGPTLFPWAPAYFGFFLWHAIGIVVMILGLLLLGGSLHLITVPVVPLALVASAGALGAGILVAVTHQQFHFFALCVVIAGLAIVVLHRAAKAGAVT